MRGALAAGAALALAACQSRPRVYEVREVKSGKQSHFTIARGQVFRSPGEYQDFATRIRALGADSDFPAALPGVDWDREQVVVVFGGPSEESQRVELLRASELGNALVVSWRVAKGGPDRVFLDDEPALPKLPQDYEATTPFIVATIPRYEGAVSFLRRWP
jgi:hypothetical protein